MPPPTESPPQVLEGVADADLVRDSLSGRPTGDLRGRAARGTIVNAIFMVGLNFLGLIRGFAVAAFLTVSDYGIWGLLGVTLSTLMMLVQVGVDDKYIQQDDEDQEAAFQIAFSLQVALCAVFLVVIAVTMPLFALLFDNWDLLLPGYALGLAMPAISLQAPLWTFYRRMDYLRQRTLQAFDPVISLVVSVGLAAAGLGYWALVIGMVCGSWAAGIAALRASPYRLRLRYERRALGEYASFSGPIFLSAVLGLASSLAPVVVAQRAVGIVGVGAIAIAANISVYANRVDDIITTTIYPAICAVTDRAELLLESFLKSNRLALLWAAPVGVGAVLFAPDLVAFALGDKWRPAVFVIQAFALAAAVNQIGFNWTAFYRALGRTRPLAVAAAVAAISVVGIAVPLLLWKGVDGFGVGMGLATLVYVALRLMYLGRIFPLRAVVANTVRGIAPSLPALGVVLVVRALAGGGERGAAQFMAEAALFVIVVIGLTALSERALLQEFRGYLRRNGEEATQPAWVAQAAGPYTK